LPLLYDGACPNANPNRDCVSFTNGNSYAYSYSYAKSNAYGISGLGGCQRKRY